MILAALLLLAQSPDFRDVARERGLVHAFPNGGTETKRFIIETTGSGAGWIDYDRDGFLDAFVLSGAGGSNRLFRNVGGRRFVDVTAETGVATKDQWSQGLCAGDFDSDGFVDAVVTSWGKVELLRNEGGKRFRKATVAEGGYFTGCAFLDYDRDGDLDLFVADYLEFDPATTPPPGANPYCFYRGMAVNCGPRGLPFRHNHLFRNDGGKLTDVSKESGVAAPRGHYALGVATGDFDNDGWVDVYVACDQTPSLLYRNNGDGTFSEEAVLRGAAFDENGRALSGMGAAAGDYDGDGWLDLFRTNFSDERETLYRNRGEGVFDDVTAAAGLARNTRFVGWGCAFLDFDNSGRPGLLLVNGHVFPEVDRLRLPVKYRDRAILYRNRGDGTFDDISEAAGPAVVEPHSSRGLAVGDIDNDGALEVLINHQNEAPSLWRMAAQPKGNWLIVDLPPSAVGARVTVEAQGRKQVQEMRSGGSYLSQSDLRLHFGLGGAVQADLVQVTWLDGTQTRRTKVTANQIVSLAAIKSRPN